MRYATAILGNLRMYPEIIHQNFVQWDLDFLVMNVYWMGDVGYHDSEIQTPNIDRLVAEGVEMDRFYAFILR